MNLSTVYAIHIFPSIQQFKVHHYVILTVDRQKRFNITEGEVKFFHSNDLHIWSRNLSSQGNQLAFIKFRRSLQR